MQYETPEVRRHRDALYRLCERHNLKPGTGRALPTLLELLCALAGNEGGTLAEYLRDFSAEEAPEGLRDLAGHEHTTYTIRFREFILGEWHGAPDVWPEAWAAIRGGYAPYVSYLARQWWACREWATCELVTHVACHFYPVPA